MPIDNDKQFTASLGRQSVFVLSVLCLVVFVTRLPWILEDPGRDPDAYRVIAAASHIAQTGEYIYSRPPGNPVHEYLVSLLPNKNNAAMVNGLTAIFSSIAALFFALILRHFEVRGYLYLTMAFALTPVIYVNSTVTMDYLIALAFALGSTYFALTGRIVSSGIFLGLAIGSRITSGAMLFPLLFFLYRKDGYPESKRSLLLLSAASLIVGGLSYLPAAFHYGIGFFSFADNIGYPSVLSLLNTGVEEVWGRLGSIALLLLFIFLPFCWSFTRRAFSNLKSRQAIELSIITITLYVIAFLRLPHESAYMVPVVPFFILLVSLVIPPNITKAFAAALMLASFVSIGRSGIGLEGPIREDHWRRHSSVAETRAVITKSQSLPENSVIVAAWNRPKILFRLGRNSASNHEWLYLIDDPSDVEQYIRAGRSVYYLEGFDRFNKEALDIDLPALGAKELNITKEELAAAMN